MTRASLMHLSSSTPTKATQKHPNSYKLALESGDESLAGYGSHVRGTVVTHVKAPVAWGPRIIDTAVATPLPKVLP
ncbi:hypothetical protein TNCV_1041241 [Trichonephila clavipes]|nr:hypothetical protein TNCV_1041241 [Trichonephila clavipes]